MLVHIYMDITGDVVVVVVVVDFRQRGIFWVAT